MRIRTYVIILMVAATLTVFVVAAAGPGAGAAPAKFPRLVGTWTGDYRFPSGTDVAVQSHERLVIQRQDGELLWGYDEFVENGQPVRIPVRGSVDQDGKGFGLAETSGLFIGRVRNRNTVDVRFFRTDDKYTSFAARLTRAAG